MSFGDGWILRFPARLSPMHGLSADSCSYGRAFDSRFLRVGLAASPLRFSTVLVTFPGYLLSGNETKPMSGTLGAASRRDGHCNQLINRGGTPAQQAGLRSHTDFCYQSEHTYDNRYKNHRQLGDSVTIHRCRHSGESLAEAQDESRNPVKKAKLKLSGSRLSPG